MDLSQLVDDVKRHAEECMPRECCGLALLKKGRLLYQPCTNLASHAGQFALDPKAWAEAEDDPHVTIVGVCHSHVFIPPEPSAADRTECARSGLPWLIVNVPNGDHVQLEPDANAITPLLGRVFVHGVHDCYSVIRDYYSQRLGLDIPDFERGDQWWLHGGNLYLDGFEQAGFMRVDDAPRAHDVLLMQVASPVPNHAAIMQPDGTIIQHCAGRLSSCDVYGGYWQKACTHVLRHQSLLEVRA